MLWVHCSVAKLSQHCQSSLNMELCLPKQIRHHQVFSRSLLQPHGFHYDGLQADIESQARRMETQVTAAQAVAAAAQAEKGSTQDQVQRLEGEKASIQRQLDEVSAQLNQERAKANELETKGTVATAEADVRNSCSSAADLRCVFLEPHDLDCDVLQQSLPLAFEHYCVKQPNQGHPNRL